jgi:hypothetical protein
MQDDARHTGSILRRVLPAMVLGLGLAGSASAALFEIPGPVSDPLYGPAARTHGSGLAAGSALQPAALHRAAGGADTASAENPLAHGAATLKAVYEANADVHSMVDTPYPVVSPPAATEPSAPDLWTILIVIAGLIAYQLRRKSRDGAIRIRPD